jgi:hypothetical protein
MAYACRTGGLVHVVGLHLRQRSWRQGENPTTFFCATSFARARFEAAIASGGKYMMTVTQNTLAKLASAMPDSSGSVAWVKLNIRVKPPRLGKQALGRIETGRRKAVLRQPRGVAAAATADVGRSSLAEEAATMS